MNLFSIGGLFSGPTFAYLYTNLEQIKPSSIHPVWCGCYHSTDGVEAVNLNTSLNTWKLLKIIKFVRTSGVSLALLLLLLLTSNITKTISSPITLIIHRLNRFYEEKT